MVRAREGPARPLRRDARTGDRHGPISDHRRRALAERRARRLCARPCLGDCCAGARHPLGSRRREQRAASRTRQAARAGGCGAMPSSALASWRKRRGERLDDLLHAHRSVGGSARGRRWRTATLNEALLLRLAAEFQGFARDLHQEACDIFAAWTAPSNLAVRQVVRAQLMEGRELERGNARGLSTPTAAAIRSSRPPATAPLRCCSTTVADRAARHYACAGERSMASRNVQLAVRLDDCRACGLLLDVGGGIGRRGHVLR